MSTRRCGPIREILKRHLGDHIVPTNFLVAENEAGQPCIMIVQEEVEGRKVSDIPGAHSQKGLYEQLGEILAGAREAGSSHELRKLLDEGKLYLPALTPHFYVDAGHEKNLIVDNSGRVRVVDW